MLVCLRAERQSRELPANAIMAIEVRTIMRECDIEYSSHLQIVALCAQRQRTGIRYPRRQFDEGVKVSKDHKTKLLSG